MHQHSESLSAEMSEAPLPINEEAEQKSTGKKSIMTARLRMYSCSALALGCLAFGSTIAQARITQIQILTRGTAFGGHSFAGVGQYEFITGIATGEVDPANPQNSLITDIGLAPKNARGHVVYQHNFYILQPLTASNG